jgi:cytochrome c biogenesis protein CcmG/thiol:disulfide interchange protein DsbE
MRVFWPVTVAAAALVGLLAYGVVAKRTDTTLDEAVAKGQRPAAPSVALPYLQKTGTGSLAE